MRRFFDRAIARMTPLDVFPFGRVVMFAFAIVVAAPACAASDGADIQVRVTRDGDTIIVVVDCPVHASAAQVWEVLTDFDHMTRFLSHLELSRAEDRGPLRLRVYQKGSTTSGFVRFAFENVRDVELTPIRYIRSRFIGGDLNASEYETEIEEGTVGVRIINRGRYVPGMFVPPLVGPVVIAAETRKQFVQIRDEILRRKSARDEPAPAPAAR